MRQDAVIVSSDGRGLAILDPSAPAALGSTWIVGMVGTLRSLVELLDGISAGTAERRESVIVDSPASPVLQQAMDREGFEPPDRDGDFLIVQRP
ncbi:MAG TPA: hypothetical protein VGR25_03710 [bacterium]|nr:hypothetical protein [bacterium]